VKIKELLQILSAVISNIKKALLYVAATGHNIRRCESRKPKDTSTDTVFPIDMMMMKMMAAAFWVDAPDYGGARKHL
jgi:hypothetical protein